MTSLNILNLALLHCWRENEQRGEVKNYSFRQKKNESTLQLNCPFSGISLKMLNSMATLSPMFCQGQNITFGGLSLVYAYKAASQLFRNLYFEDLLSKIAEKPILRNSFLYSYQKNYTWCFDRVQNSIRDGCTKSMTDTRRWAS